MIRSNWSLAKEVRQNELKQKQKLQQRQKHQHKLEKLSKADPVRLYFQIERLEKEKSNETRLKLLKEDWQFIRKNKLHREKLDEFLEQQKEKKAKQEKNQRKLWGKTSIYFNPELNPLGKVPVNENGEPFPNLTVPLRQTVKCSPDPLIQELGITLPREPQPQFYKAPQNITIQKAKEEVKPKTTSKPKSKPESTSRNLDFDSDYEGYSSSDEEQPYKKTKLQ